MKAATICALLTTLDSCRLRLPPFVNCHSENKSIFVLLPNDPWVFRESPKNPKIEFDTVEKQNPANQLI